MAAYEAVPHRILALCERVDIAAFLDVYLKYLRSQGVVIPEMRIVNLQAIQSLPGFIDKLEQAQVLENIAKIILFADAGVKRRATEHFIFKTKKYSFLQDFAFEFYLFPQRSEVGNWTPGFLEDVLVPALQQQTAEASDFYNLKNIAHEFVFSVQNSRGKDKRFANYNRHFLYSYFAGTEKFVGLRLGEAAAKGAFDLEHEGFNDLKEFLSSLEE